jgi:hypothetical protein
MGGLNMAKTLDLKKLKFFTLVLAIYLVTASFVLHVNLPIKTNKVEALKLARNLQTPYIPFKPKFVEINGMPVKIVLPDSNVNLPIVPGYYSADTNSWTLTGREAQFAMISTLPNNLAGQTFIYGHNNDYVFGALRHVTPSIGQPALLYLSNGHILQYSFLSVQSVGPTQTSVLSYTSKPTLLIQTCTGSLNELRTEYSYKFVKVVQ